MAFVDLFALNDALRHLLAEVERANVSQAEVRAAIEIFRGQATGGNVSPVPLPPPPVPGTGG